jgi:prophage regulatory protein
VLESIQAELEAVRTELGKLRSATRLPAEGFVRIKQIIGDPNAEPPVPAVIPISASSWWDGVAQKTYPDPIRHGRVTLWRVDDIRKLIARISSEGGE